MSNMGRIEIPYGARNLVIETGKIAKQANGAVTVTIGGTVVLVSVCMSKKPREGIDFFPLTVEYQEKTYAAGRIPGGFFKREGRPTEKEILTSRLIDRPVRPLFPNGFFNDVQVVALVLSHDGENDPDVPALIGASAALMISDIPYSGPIAAVRIGLLDDQLIVNPTYEQRGLCKLDLVVAGKEDGIIMIEGEFHEIPDNKVVEALQFAHDALKPIAAIQKKLQQSVGRTKTAVQLKEPNKELISKVRQLTEERLKKAYKIADKQERSNAVSQILDDIIKDMSAFDACKKEEEEISADKVKVIFEELEYEEVRRNVLENNKRADGRKADEIREISCEVGLLPRTHGSSLFTRGQTQSLSIVTLGTRTDEQLVESLEGTTYKSFMLHYNFPSFSVGETKPMRGPGRREIGHGALAAKSVEFILPSKDEFPYTIRLVSEILESNGSSSMATVCASTLALMDAGVPIKDAVAGISIGLISTKEGEEGVLLTDIMGFEDHFGDMDFKVAGTRKGITAIQLDLKITKISVKLLAKAVEQAKKARMFILDKMHAVMPQSRPEISEYAPKVFIHQIPVDKIGEIIGPGGKTIKKIIEETGVTAIDIEEDGKVVVAAPDKTSGEKAINFIKGMTQEPEIGKIYDAKVKRIMNFGAFCEYMPGREGLVHISELSSTFVKDINTIVKVGDEFKVKLIEVDEMKRVNLSKKQADEK